MKLSFNGSAVGIVVAAGPDAGVIRYSIDKGPNQQLDLYTRWSAHLHLPWYYVLEAALDLEIPHTLEIEMVSRPDETKGGAVWEKKTVPGTRDRVREHVLC